ncbi:hypothetical protein [Thiocystis violacea]|uniref:hypothetical protein n=1 Tax=Thiocystis violacea TaxID=13725 RepID=UPI001903C815|nr:hypothetical protein [Thiocystis violacea]
MHRSERPILHAGTRRAHFAVPSAFLFISLLITTASNAENLHGQITNAILGLASENASTKNESIRFLLAAPPEFRENMDAQYRAEAKNLAESLPQKIDAYTTAQGVLVTASETQMTYTIHYNEGSFSEKEVQDFSHYLTAQANKQVCGTPGSTLLSLLYGKDLVRNYYYQTGEPFLAVRVTWDDCR